MLIVNDDLMGRYGTCPKSFSKVVRKQGLQLRTAQCKARLGTTRASVPFHLGPQNGVLQSLFLLGLQWLHPLTLFTMLNMLWVWDSAQRLLRPIGQSCFCFVLVFAVVFLFLKPVDCFERDRRVSSSLDLILPHLFCS